MPASAKPGTLIVWSRLLAHHESLDDVSGRQTVGVMPAPSSEELESLLDGLRHYAKTQGADLDQAERKLSAVRDAAERNTDRTDGTVGDGMQLVLALLSDSERQGESRCQCVRLGRRETHPLCPVHGMSPGSKHV